MCVEFIPESAPSPLSFSDPRAGIHFSPPPTPFNPVIPRLREESGGKRPLHHSGRREPESIPRGGAAHPEQSRRVERGEAQFCQYISLCPHLHPSSPVIPMLREESRTCLLTTFIAFPPSTSRPSVIPAAESRNPSLEAARVGRPVPSPSDGRGLG